MGVAGLCLGGFQIPSGLDFFMEEIKLFILMIGERIATCIVVVIWAYLWFKIGRIWESREVNKKIKEDYR